MLNEKNFKKTIKKVYYKDGNEKDNTANKVIKKGNCKNRC